MRAELFHADEGTDGRTDVKRDMTKLIIAFHSLANAPRIFVLAEKHLKPESLEQRGETAQSVWQLDTRVRWFDSSQLYEMFLFSETSIQTFGPSSFLGDKAAEALEWPLTSFCYQVKTKQTSIYVTPYIFTAWKGKTLLVRAWATHILRS